jgi:hypothetical protein
LREQTRGRVSVLSEELIRQIGMSGEDRRERPWPPLRPPPHGVIDEWRRTSR